jgi:hypothetical protein
VTNKAMLFSMTETERVLVAETDRDELQALDEDALLALETRIRRARNKYVKLYRRQASANVAEQGGRGFAAPQNQRDRDKAEVFELALARVSRQVAVVARKAADQLRAERLEAARQGRGSWQPPGQSSPSPSPSPETAGTDRRVPHQKTTGGIKKDASTRAMGAKRQAQRDNR